MLLDPDELATALQAAFEGLSNQPQEAKVLAQEAKRQAGTMLRDLVEQQRE